MSLIIKIRIIRLAYRQI